MKAAQLRLLIALARWLLGDRCDEFRRAQLDSAITHAEQAVNSQPPKC